MCVRIAPRGLMVWCSTMKLCPKCGAQNNTVQKTCRDCYNAYMADYMLRRYHQRHTEAIIQLGGKCAKCNARKNLDIDHIDPSQKTYTIGNILVSAPEARYKKELAKCQLLCKKHHIQKTRNEQTVGHGGGLTGVRRCWCELCAPLKRDYSNKWRREKRRREREAKTNGA